MGKPPPFEREGFLQALRESLRSPREKRRGSAQARPVKPAPGDQNQSAEVVIVPYMLAKLRADLANGQMSLNDLIRRALVEGDQHAIFLLNNLGGKLGQDKD